MLTALAVVGGLYVLLVLGIAIGSRKASALVHPPTVELWTLDEMRKDLREQITEVHEDLRSLGFRLAPGLTLHYANAEETLTHAVFFERDDVHAILLFARVGEHHRESWNLWSPSPRGGVVTVPGRPWLTDLFGQRELIIPDLDLESALDIHLRAVALSGPPGRPAGGTDARKELVARLDAHQDGLIKRGFMVRDHAVLRPSWWYALFSALCVLPPGLFVVRWLGSRKRAGYAADPQRFLDAAH